MLQNMDHFVDNSDNTDMVTEVVRLSHSHMLEDFVLDLQQKIVLSNYHNSGLELDGNNDSAHMVVYIVVELVDTGHNNYNMDNSRMDNSMDIV